MTGQRRAARRRRYPRGRRWLRGLLEGLLSIVILLCSMGLLIMVLAPWEEETGPAASGPDALQIYTRQDTPPASPEHTAPVSRTISSAEAWELLLVNRWNPMPEDMDVSLTQLQNGLWVDERCYAALQEMISACKAEGLSPVICSAYRSREKQEELFSKRVNRLMAQGYSQGEAEEEAGRLIAVPGTSEHQTGLAVDIVDQSNQLLDESQENTAVQRWLMAHSWEYGFILRYPQEKSELTGISYEPWHYRYVGREHAEEIYTLDVCLEEYLEKVF